MTSSSIARRFCDSDREASPISPPKYRLPISVIGRLQLEKEIGGSGSCSSSADSTPQKRPGLPPKPHLTLQTGFPAKPDFKLHIPTPATINNNPDQNPNSNQCRFSEVPPQANRPSRLTQQHPAMKKPISSRFFGFESESCSSAVSSLDSVCSGSSDGLVNSSRSNSDLSSANSSIPSRSQLPPKMLNAKFQVFVKSFLFKQSSKVYFSFYWCIIFNCSSKKWCVFHKI